MLHVIPTVGYSHWHTAECRCRPQLTWDAARRREVLRHPEIHTPPAALPERGPSMTILERFVGVHEDAAPTDIASRYPGARWARRFISDNGRPLPSYVNAAWLIQHVQGAVQPSLDAGGGCVVSVKLDLAAVATGLWDDRLYQLGTVLNGQNIIVVFNHEPENDMSPAVFTAGFTAARSAFKAGAPAVRVGYAAMAYQWRPKSKTTKDPQAWARVPADLYLLDVYSGQSFPETTILPEHPGFVRWYAEVIAAHPGRVWALAERGWHSGANRAATVLREAAWFATDPIGQTCSGCLVWGTEGTEKNTAWELNDDPSREAIAGYTAVLSTPLSEALGEG